MTAPAVLGVSLGASIFGSIYKAKGEKDLAESKAKTYEYQAGVAEVNKDIALQNRDYAFQVGESEAVAYGLKAQRRAGQLKAAQGASGIDIGSESSVAVREGQKATTRLDLATIRSNAARVAYGYESEAVQYENQAELYRRGAKDTRKAGRTSATASLISGVSSVADKWGKASSVGLI